MRILISPLKKRLSWLLHQLREPRLLLGRPLKKSSKR